MTRETRVTVGVVTLSALGLLVPSTALAQYGPGRHGPESVTPQPGPSRDLGPAYDSKSETIFKGTAVEVKTARSRSGVRETQLLLKTDTGTLEIQLGPTAFLAEKQVEIRKGDTLEVTGSRVTIGEAPVVLARDIRMGDDAWVLRDATGRPLWSSGRTEARGFWTKKRVLLAVIVVKVVVATVATVLLR